MKYILIVILASFFVSCAVSPERQSISDEYQKRADAGRIQAATHGSLKGTPENIAGINKSLNEADEFQDRSNDKSSTILEKILTFFVDR